MQKKKQRKRGQFYIDRAELLQDVIESKKKGEMTDGLSSKLLLLTRKYAHHPNFSRYTYNQDMQGYANLTLCQVWRSFDSVNRDNPFAYYTQCIKNAFKQFLNMEKRHRDIRDDLLVEDGLDPSSGYTLTYELENHHQPEHGEVKILNRKDNKEIFEMYDVKGEPPPPKDNYHTKRRKVDLRRAAEGKTAIDWNDKSQIIAYRKEVSRERYRDLKDKNLEQKREIAAKHYIKNKDAIRKKQNERYHAAKAKKKES